MVQFQPAALAIGNEEGIAIGHGQIAKPGNTEAGDIKNRKPHDRQMQGAVPSERGAENRGHEKRPKGG